MRLAMGPDGQIRAPDVRARHRVVVPGMAVDVAALKPAAGKAAVQKARRWQERLQNRPVRSHSGQIFPGAVLNQRSGTLNSGPMGLESTGRNAADGLGKDRNCRACWARRSDHLLLHASDGRTRWSGQNLDHSSCGEVTGKCQKYRVLILPVEPAGLSVGDWGARRSGAYSVITTSAQRGRISHSLEACPHLR